jgi:hypothetical protein
MSSASSSSRSMATTPKAPSPGSSMAA